MKTLTLAALAMLSAVGLGGCAAQQNEAARARRNAADAACSAEFPAKVGNFVARANCMNRNQVTFMAEVHAVDSDLAGVFMATRSKLAVMQDRREISPEDANLQLAQLNSQWQMENQRRASARLAAVLPLLQMQHQQMQHDEDSFLQAIRPVYTPQNRSLDCRQTSISGSGLPFQMTCN